MARALMPRQPYSIAVQSDRRSGYIPCPLRGKGLGKSGGAFLKGKEGQVGFRKKCQPYSEAVQSDGRSGYILRPFVKGEGLGVG